MIPAIKELTVQWKNETNNTKGLLNHRRKVSLTSFKIKKIWIMGMSVFVTIVEGLPYFWHIVGV